MIKVFTYDVHSTQYTSLTKLLYAFLYTFYIDCNKMVYICSVLFHNEHGVLIFDVALTIYNVQYKICSGERSLYIFDILDSIESRV